jgi:hypothetical protein
MASSYDRHIQVIAQPMAVRQAFGGNAVFGKKQEFDV